MVRRLHRHRKTRASKRVGDRPCQRSKFCPSRPCRPLFDGAIWRAQYIVHQRSHEPTRPPFPRWRRIVARIAASGESNGRRPICRQFAALEIHLGDGVGYDGIYLGAAMLAAVRPHAHARRAELDDVDSRVRLDAFVGTPDRARDASCRAEPLPNGPWPPSSRSPCARL